jgi:hypothetical protein
MSTHDHHTPQPDPQIGAALRALHREPPLEEVDWEALRGSIRDRAALPMARRRKRAAAPPRWVRPLLPLAVAASVALALWIGTELGEGRLDTIAVERSAAPAAAEPSVEEVFGADLSEQEFRLLVSERANPDELLLVAVGGS